MIFSPRKWLDFMWLDLIPNQTCLTEEIWTVKEYSKESELLQHVEFIDMHCMMISVTFYSLFLLPSTRSSHISYFTFNCIDISRNIMYTAHNIFTFHFTPRRIIGDNWAKMLASHSQGSFVSFFFKRSKVLKNYAGFIGAKFIV